MSGLRNICRMSGGMTINGKKFAWDYVAEEAVPEADMPFGSDRWKASERARYSMSAWQKAGIIPTKASDRAKR